MNADFPHFSLSTDIHAIGFLDPETHIPLPMAGDSVQAGFPSAAEDFMEASLDLNELLIKRPPATFFVRVAGYSMVNVGIYPDDILVVDRAEDVEKNDIVIAAVDGELTVKRYVNEAGHIRLVAENDDFPDIDFKDGSELLIWGVVRTNLRRFKK